MPPPARLVPRVAGAAPTTRLPGTRSVACGKARGEAAEGGREEQAG